MAMEVISHPESGNIAQVGYDADEQALYITFRWQSAIYRYRPVSGDDAAGFAQALSATDHLKNVILPLAAGERIA